MKIKFYSPVTITHWNGCSVPEFNHDYLIEQLEIQCSDLLFRAVCYPEKYGHRSPYGTRYFSYRDNRLYLVSEILVLHPNKDISCTGQWGQELNIPIEDKSMFKEYLEYLYGSVNGDLSDGWGEEFEQRVVSLKHPEGTHSPANYHFSPQPVEYATWYGCALENGKITDCIKYYPISGIDLNHGFVSDSNTFVNEVITSAITYHVDKDDPESTIFSLDFLEVYGVDREFLVAYIAYMQERKDRYSITDKVWAYFEELRSHLQK